jgi:predicted dehydrogenase
MDRIRVGMIGYGVGKLHATALRDVGLYYPDFPPIELSAIATATAASGERARRHLGFQWSTTDYRELMEDDQIEVVVIASPNQWHRDMLTAALRAGKSIYMDKPLATNLAEARDILAVAEQTGNDAQMAFEFRFCPALQHASRLIREGRLGEVHAFRASYFRSSYTDPEKPLRWKALAESNGGVLNDYASHLIDLVLWLTETPKAVAAEMRTFIKRRPPAKGSSELADVETDDHTTVLCALPGGGIGTLEAGRLIHGATNDMGLDIYGSRASIRWTLMDPNYLYLAQAPLDSGEAGWLQVPTIQRYEGALLPGDDVPVGMMRFHIASAADFLRRTLKGQGYDPNLRQGARVQAVVEAATQSAKTGSWTPVPEVD